MRTLLITLVIFLAGCTSGEFKMVPVSGTITVEGEPLVGAEVVFAPMEIKDQIDVGPVSIGVTDSSGKYSLKTVKGLEGAVVTNHRVSVSFGEIDEAAVAAEIDKVVQKNRAMPEEEVMALENQVRQSMMNTKAIPDTYNSKTKLRFEVIEATESADFNLKSDGS